MITHGQDRVESIKLDILNGVYSNFPTCCIDWFIYVRYLIGDDKIPVGEYTKLHFGDYKTEDWNCIHDGCDYDGRPGYVVCPTCRKNKNHRKPSELRLGVWLYYNGVLTFFTKQKMKQLIKEKKW
jgi:hypothetical protein